MSDRQLAILLSQLADQLAMIRDTLNGELLAVRKALPEEEQYLIEVEPVAFLSDVVETPLLGDLSEMITTLNNYVEFLSVTGGAK